MPLGQFSLDHQVSPYLVSDVRVEYTYDDGSRGLPIAYRTGLDAGSPTEVVRVSKPRLLKVVTFHFVRQQQLPSLEGVRGEPLGEKLVWARIVPTSHQVSPNGQRVYEVYGMLVFEVTQVASTYQLQWPRDPVDAGQAEGPINFLPAS